DSSKVQQFPWMTVSGDESIDAPIEDAEQACATLTGVVRGSSPPIRLIPLAWEEDDDEEKDETLDDDEDLDLGDEDEDFFEDDEEEEELEADEEDVLEGE